MLAQLVGFGRHTISSLLRTQNPHQLDWSADDRFYSEDRFEEDTVFTHIRAEVEHTVAKKRPLVVALDDSLFRKTGRKIHGLRYLRDPLSHLSTSTWSRDCGCSSFRPRYPRGVAAPA